ncbi:MAG: peptide-methionine (S)-S-oxide reductase MsrA [Magnetococcales bacterium]|nr:peptide-methionine (S)-S-oxide reductase MsrA [Magnetococcales bacterium]
MSCTSHTRSTAKLRLKAAILLFLFVVLTGASVDTEASPTQSKTATFAGGCFWCVEHLFDEVEGVISTVSGYTDGEVENPTYSNVSAGHTGHTEAVQVVFDPTQVSYDQLLTLFWRNIDPTTPNQQFCDHGSQYRSAIFFHSDEQKKQALDSLNALQNNKPFTADIVTEIKPNKPFFPAEEYHQDYHHKNPIRYRFYRHSCGRDQRLKELWGAGK